MSEIIASAELQGPGTTADSNVALFVATNPNDLQVVIREGDPVPDAPANVILRSVLFPSISDAGMITFLGSLGGSGTIGRFQFVVGRELGVTFYGLQASDQLIAPAVDGSGPRIVDFESIAYDLPLLEYRPYRAFSTNQSSSVIVQLFASADVPRSASTVFPAGAPTPDLRTVWAVGLRLVFDWRYYP